MRIATRISLTNSLDKSALTLAKVAPMDLPNADLLCTLFCHKRCQPHQSQRCNKDGQKGHHDGKFTEFIFVLVQRIQLFVKK